MWSEFLGLVSLIVNVKLKISNFRMKEYGLFVMVVFYNIRNIIGRRLNLVILKWMLAWCFGFFVFVCEVFNVETAISSLTDLCVRHGEAWTNLHTFWIPPDPHVALHPPEPTLALPLLCLRPVHYASGHQHHPGGSVGHRERERHHHRGPSPLTGRAGLLRFLLRVQQIPGPHGSSG